MKKLILTISAAGVFACGGIAHADSITLNGTIRDFSSNHPDFEMSGLSYGVVTGIVGNTLGSDGNPVFSGSGSSHVTTGANFNQWFNDVPGVNQSQAYAIALDDSGHPGVFIFSDNDFFPIDGQLNGNEGLSHNYHFTYEIHTSFFYDDPADYFSFTGDDDVWIFINDKLVVDLGGVHGAAPGSVTLGGLGLTLNNSYDLTFFFAERHTSESNFMIETNIGLHDPVPEPATMLLFGAGLTGLAGFRLRRKK